MATSRFRTRNDLVSYSGSSYWNPITNIAIGHNGEWKDCYDIVGNFPNANPFDLKSRNVVRPVLDGEKYVDGVLDRKLIGYPIDYVPTPIDPEAWLPVPDSGDLQNMAWETLAECNLSEPHVGLPSFFAELKDLPSLIQSYGQSLIKEYAASYLAMRWALMPMYHDLRKMLSFYDACYSRSLELQLLQRQKKSRKRASLGSDSYVLKDPDKLIHSSTGFFLEADRTVTMQSKAWGSVEWSLKPGFEMPVYDEVERDRFARSLVTGMNTQAFLTALWEITPWSWLADWFFGISNVLAACNNEVPVTWGRVCVMVNQRSESRFTNIRGIPDWCKLSSAPVEEFERKLRYPVVPLLPFVPSFKPLVSKSAWSIIASLAILRVPNRWAP